MPKRQLLRGIRVASILRWWGVGSMLRWWTPSRGVCSWVTPHTPRHGRIPPISSSSRRSRVGWWRCTITIPGSNTGTSLSRILPITTTTTATAPAVRTTATPVVATTTPITTTPSAVTTTAATVVSAVTTSTALAQTKTDWYQCCKEATQSWYE